ncbi:hypothetical protein CVT26_011033 [Gymnopilus dilepis]|uniref:Transcription and mRNA export factor SUS1 n=1 Tax=Gymnopilus dilepis TaxID=231916 RepID=A0A409VY17_9AGAR|nr:hypothetical protein CVT26_011033 [Gymnopilus dilepis]
MPHAESIDALFTQVRRRLVESGEWEQIRAALSAKLNESGWTDDIHHKSKEVARNMEPLSFSKLHADFAPRAETSVPLAVKREISNMIRQHLEKQFE